MRRYVLRWRWREVGPVEAEAEDAILTSLEGQTGIASVSLQDTHHGRKLKTRGRTLVVISAGTPGKRELIERTVLCWQARIEGVIKSRTLSWEDC